MIQRLNSLKPIGIVLFSYLAVTLNVARLPENVNWRVMLAGGSIAGIGFTMSLLLAALSLEGPQLEAGKIGVLLGSTISAVIGSILLAKVLPSADTVQD